MRSRGGPKPGGQLAQFRVFKSAVRWVSANRARFFLPSADRLPADAQEDPRRKAFGELLIVCMLMSRCARAVRLPEYRTLVNHLQACASRPGVWTGAVRTPYLFHSALLAFSGLAACGRPSAELRGLVRRILAMGYVDRIDRTPWNQADFRFHLEHGRFKHDLPDTRTVYRASTLRALPSIPWLQSYDAYAITHVIFFLSEFGKRSLAPLLGPRFAATVEYVHLLLGVAAHRNNVDLMAELLMCCACLRTYESPTISAAWAMLQAAQDRSGYIHRKNDTFKAVYHPTIVALIAGLLWLDRH